MNPSFDLGFTTLPAYFTLLMVGMTAGILLAHREGLRRGMNGNAILDLGLLMMACGLIGSRVLHVIADGHFWDYVHLCTDPAQLKGLALSAGRTCTADAQCLSAGLGDLCDTATGLCRQQRDCLRVFKIWYGGYVFYGGLLLCVPVGLWFLKRRQVEMWDVADLAGWAVPFGLILGRLGCFLAGCCFGGVTEGPTGIAFPRFSPAWHRHVTDHLIDRSAHASLHVHPTQLYEAIAAALIFALGYWRYRKGRHFRGELFFQFLALYAIFRILVEFIRDDDRGQWLWGLATTSQLVSLPALAWAAYAIWRRRAWPWPPQPTDSGV
ncbi:MAG: prolipoprotein diacylglyceryl transferase [Myxococcales bacterium]|nr:prolipoprotein diacylglyceryl transferase [Myxococcales bacterium]